MTQTTPPPEELEALRFPVGRFEPPSSDHSMDVRHALIDRIAAAPAGLRAAVAGLSDDQLDTRYRPEGWTVRQVVHHVADSHINSYVRFKLTLTEDRPTIRTYHEAEWGELEDARTFDIGVSLDLLEALHARWTGWLETLTPEEWERRLDHPEWGEMTLDQLLSMYAWHGEHHAAHIARLREREGW